MCNMAALSFLVRKLSLRLKFLFKAHTNANTKTSAMTWAPWKFVLAHKKEWPDAVLVFARASKRTLLNILARGLVAGQTSSVHLCAVI